MDSKTNSYYVARCYSRLPPVLIFNPDQDGTLVFAYSKALLVCFGGETVKKKRLSLDLPEDLAEQLDQIADHEGMTIAELVRRSIGTTLVYSDMIKSGYMHLGVADDIEKLRVPFTGLLDLTKRRAALEREQDNDLKPEMKKKAG